MPSLDGTQRQQLVDEGYLVVEDVLDPRDHIEPVMAEYGVILGGLAESLYAEGAIASTYEDLPFADRLIRVCLESGRTYGQHFDCSLPQRGVRQTTPIHVGPAVFGLLTHPYLLDLVESVVGPEIYSNPVQHVRMKLPARAVAPEQANVLVAKVPWHQDNGVILPEADDATILTVWIALTDATLENGCLQLIPGSHRAGLQTHCAAGGTVAIPERMLSVGDAHPLPMRAGSALLMHQRTVHSSLDNVTENEVRISFDLRYQPVGQATGRPAFPGFDARSATRPATVLRDPVAWAQSWYDARERLAAAQDPTYNRWRADSPVCA